MFKAWISLVLAIGLGTALAGWKVDGSDPDAGGGGGGSTLTRVEVTTVGNITSTVTSDTIYVWDDFDASQDLEITIPSAAAAGAGTRITFISLNMDHGLELKVNINAADKVYDDYDEVNNGGGGNTTGFRTFYAYFRMTFISDGDSFWTTINGNDGYWEAQ